MVSLHLGLVMDASDLLAAWRALNKLGLKVRASAEPQSAASQTQGRCLKMDVA